MLHARQYEPAAAALHRVLALEPTLPEAHVNMGFAMLGLQRLKEARDFFEGATALHATQANAYYGLALVSEAQGDLPLAIGAMRSYLHLAGADASAEHLRRARAALWTWESRRDPP
jgi:tetratricopeptide (TPR) repeat protein